MTRSHFTFAASALAVGVTILSLATACSTSYAENPKVLIETSHGDIEAELFAEEAPITVKNFLGYVEKGFYEETIFHRVIEDFMIQCGGFTADMKEKKTDEPIKNESTNDLENEKYTLAMARTSAPNSATSQFFINTKNNSFLNRKSSRDRVGYCVFGKVTSGQEVVDKIAKVATTSRGIHDDVPVKAIVIKKISLVPTKHDDKPADTPKTDSPKKEDK